jgi:cation:H+ antiporter
LGVAIPAFLASAVVVVFAGIALAKYGDELAEKTGWGALWVGTVLVSVATSLPELITNISAVVFQDSPDLALGNVYGANMINIFTVSIVAMIFGVQNVFGGQRKDTQVLVLVAVGLGIIALAIGATGDFALGPTSVGGLVIAAAYFGGMKLVYSAGKSIPVGDDEARDAAAATESARSAWIGFGIASLAIVAAAPLLAASATGIAGATSLGESFVGVLAVSIVTTLPEATVSVTAARRGSYGLVLGNIYGSCAFNLFVIPVADLGMSDPLLGKMGSEHFLAIGSAIALMFIGYVVIKSYQVQAIAWMRRTLYGAPVLYTAAVAGVFIMSQD